MLTQTISGKARSWEPREAMLSCRSWVVWLLALCVIACALPGCGGCRKEDPAAAEKKKKEDEEKKKKKEQEKPKPDFDPSVVNTQPGNRNLLSAYAKPGHWVTSTQRMKANNFDFVGDMQAAIVDSGGDPVFIENTPFRLTTDRSVVLAKGQEKYIECTFFVPHQAARPKLRTVLRSKHGGGGDRLDDSLFSVMPAYQYFFVILSNSPDSYRLEKLHSFNVPWGDTSNTTFLNYRVVAPRAKKPVPLPSHPLTWTSIAHFLWDDFDPTLLSPEQQQAMIDWLHWGGNLIVNGPGSLQTLRGSFLAPHLPAEYLNLKDYDDDDLDELRDFWTLRADNDKGPDNKGVALRATRPWSGITLSKHARGAPVPNTGGLLVERRIGRGRIVVSAVNLHQPDLTQWRGFDGFCNACLLRRPPRKYFDSQWGPPRLAWAATEAMPTDPRLVSHLRYFCRDAGTQFDVKRVSDQPAEPDYNSALNFGPWGQQPPDDNELDENEAEPEAR